MSPSTPSPVRSRGVRAFLARCDRALPLHEKVNRLLAQPEGRREWALRFFSRERLFSTEARLGWVEPDKRPLERGDGASDA